MPIFCYACPNKGPLKKNSIKCVNCDKYYHSSCAERIGYVSEGVVKKCCKNIIQSISPDVTLSSDSSLSPSNSTFYDIDCEDKNNNSITEISTMAKNEIDLFDRLWDKIEQKLDNGVCKKLDAFIVKCDTQFQMIQERMDSYDSRLANLEDDLIEDAVAELELRTFRKHFVIFKNIPDKNNDVEDLKYLKNIMDADRINLQLDFEKISAFRLGKFESNQILPRLLKVRFKNVEDAQYIIFNNKNFQFPNNVTCQSDKTLMQRNRLKKTLVELKNRESQGEKNLIIKYIHNVPRIIDKSTNQDKPQVAVTKTKTNTKSRSNFQPSRNQS